MIDPLCYIISSDIFCAYLTYQFIDTINRFQATTINHIIISDENMDQVKKSLRASKKRAKKAKVSLMKNFSISKVPKITTKHTRMSRSKDLRTSKVDTSFKSGMHSIPSFD